MGKIKMTFQKMSLKKSLLVLSVFYLSLVSVISIVTILKCSNTRQEILDTRPIIITDYIIDDTNLSGAKNNNGVTAVPQKYTYGELTKENQIYYWCITILMVSLPIVYIILASFMVAKLYYKWKLQMPLEYLKNGMYHISQQDLDFKILYTSNDELGQLCDTFEHMKNEIYRSNCKMWDMLQERKALTASVSHDSTIKHITGATERLERYVDCVKDIQKMEDVEIKIDTYDLKELITGITREFSVLAIQQSKQFSVHDLTKSSFIQTDKDMLLKILENVFDNALRFSSEKIMCLIEEKDEYLYFSIQDDGVGFTTEELKSATSLFFSSVTNSGNFGIGLSICKILCEKLGGNICLDNTTQHGAIITIKIKK